MLKTIEVYHFELYIANCFSKKISWMKADRRPFFMVSEKSKENLSAQIAPAPQESLLGGEEPLIRLILSDDALAKDEYVLGVTLNYTFSLL